MPEYIGYGNNSSQVPEFSKAQKEFFASLEKDLKKRLVFISGIGYGKAGVPIERPPDYDNDDTVVIRDFNIPQEYLHKPKLTERINSPENREDGSPKRIGLGSHPYTYRFRHYIPEQALNWFTTPYREFVYAAYGAGIVFTSAALANFNTTQLKLLQFKELLELASDTKKFKAEQEKKFNEMLENASSSLKTAASQLSEASKNKITDLENFLAADLAASIQRHKQIRSEALKLEHMESILAKEGDQFEKQLRELSRNIHIKEISFSPEVGGSLEGTTAGRLEIVTNQLYLYSPDGTERVPLGTMRIGLYTDGRVTFQNLTNPRGNPLRPHPHVDSSGTACWGGIQAQVSKLIAHFELVPLFETIIAYLESYHPEDDFARFAPYWFDTQPVEILQKDGSYKTEDQLNQEDQKKYTVGASTKNQPTITTAI